MNALKEKEKEKKQKLKQLEAEIKEMQRDHRETFETMARTEQTRTTLPVKSMILAAVGVITLAAAVIWLYLFPPVFDSYAVFRLGSLRFTRSIFFLPLVISAVAAILCKKRKKYIISLFPSAVIAVIGTVVTMKAELLSFPIWIYVIVYCLVFIGTALIIAALCCYKVHSEKL
ncbi:MAG: hypothetical protein ACI4JK_00365 [Oscillospiraceae bacterium]